MELLRRKLGVLFAVALVLRLGFFLCVQPWKPEVRDGVLLHGDAGGYHMLAVTLLEHGRFANGVDDPPEALRTPGYPAFIGAIYAAAGPQPWAVLLAQVLLDALSAVLMVIAVSAWLPAGTALVAGWLHALDPFLISHCAVMYSEILFLHVLVWTLVAISRELPGSRPGGSRRGTAWIAVGVAALVWIRPVAVLLFPVLGVALWERERRLGGKGLPRAVFGVALSVLLVLPWVIRNASVFGTPFLSTSGSFNLLMLNAGPGLALARTVPTGEAEISLLDEIERRVREDGRDSKSLSGYERSRYWQRLALEQVRAEPVAFASSLAMGITHSLFNLNSSGLAAMLGRSRNTLDAGAYPHAGSLLSDYFRRKGAFGVVVMLVLVPWLALTYGLLLTGLPLAARRLDRSSRIFLIGSALLLLLAGGGGGVARFRLPSIALLVPVSAIGFDGLRSRFALGRSRK